MTSLSPPHNTREGIQQALGSLKDFNELIDARRADYNKNGIGLQPFHVLGRYSLDSYGQLGYLSSSLGDLKDRFPDIPNVLTEDELHAYIREQQNDDEPRITLSTTLAGGLITLAPADKVCAICVGGWTVENAHQCVPHNGREAPSLEAYIGRTLKEFLDDLNQDPIASYSLHPQVLFSNPRYIDLTTREGGRFAKNPGGTVGSDQGFDLTHQIEVGDKVGLLNRRRFYHINCHLNGLTEAEEWAFTNMFLIAGFHGEELGITRIPNEYGSSGRRGSWFAVSSASGLIKIGWRTHVIHIDWSDTGQDFSGLFDDYTATKGPSFIHANGPADVVEVLSRLRKALPRKW